MMHQDKPTFPPLLTGYEIDIDACAQTHAFEGASNGTYGAGDFVWSIDVAYLRFGVVLEPEVSRNRCAEMLYVLMTAFGDAMGALSPPEVAVTYQWPNKLMLNGAHVGTCDLRLSQQCTSGDVPAFGVLGFQLRLMGGVDNSEPGLNADVTSLWDEGCANLNPAQLLGSIARHFVNWAHTWECEGFKPVHSNWFGRLEKKHPLCADLNLGDENIQFLGLDEHGNALIKKSDKTQVLATLDSLSVRRKNGDNAS